MSPRRRSRSRLRLHRRHRRGARRRAPLARLPRLAWRGIEGRDGWAGASRALGVWGRCRGPLTNQAWGPCRGPQPSQAPQTAAGLAGVALQLQEEGLVTDVGRDGHDLGVAETDQLGVDHRLAGPDVGQQPAVAIVRLHVELEPHALALDQAAVDRVRLAAARLLALARMVDL